MWSLSAKALPLLTVTSCWGANLPLQSASLARGLFRAENNEGPKDSGRNFDFPPNCLKNKLDRGPVPRIELSPETSAKNMGLVSGEKQGLEMHPL